MLVLLSHSTTTYCRPAHLEDLCASLAFVLSDKLASSRLDVGVVVDLGPMDMKKRALACEASCARGDSCP